MARVSLRRKLFLLATACALPLAIVSVMALYTQYRQTRAQTERAGVEIARALSVAVEAELSRTISVLQGMATSVRIDGGDLPGFRERAQRNAAVQSGWITVLLHDAQGRPLLSTAAQLGEPLTPIVERESFEQAVASARPVIGYLARGPRGKWGVPVRVPVVRDGRTQYVLTAVIDPAQILRVVSAQRVPGDWVVAVADRKGMRVARSRSTEQSLGTPFSPSLAQMIARGGSEGSGVTSASEGDQVFTAYSRDPLSGWVTAVGMPVALVEAGARASFYTLGAGILLSFIAAAFAALFIARSISRPMAQLRACALSLGRERFDPPHTDIGEIQDVAHALAESEHERSRVEAQREALLASELAARAAAEAANRAKDEFLAMLGHELRNPLGALANAAAVLGHAGADERSRQTARDIVERQVGHLTRLTDDLLDAGRALMGKIVLRRHAVDLAAVTAQALGAIEASGRTQRHDVVRDLRPVWVDADPVRLDQVVANLVGNAAKYTPPGKAIRVSVGREGAEAVLRVRDEGAGIPAALLPRIFDLFVQGDRELDRSLGGLGIGLTLVRRLAEMHGGTASASSEGDNRGSEFVVRLPAIEPVAGRAAPAAGVHTPRRRRVLIVEDNDDARATLRMLLEMSGHQVSAEADGAAGLATALRDRPEVLLVDVGLPRIDGYELARRLRAAGGWPTRPLLVALTGYGLDTDRERAMAAGFDLHLTKPVEPAAVEELLARDDAISSPPGPSR